MGIDKTNRGGKGWRETDEKTPFIKYFFSDSVWLVWNLSFTPFKIPVSGQYQISSRFLHIFYPSVERPVVLHSSFVAGTSRGSSKRNFFCFGFFLVSNFIKSIFSPPSLSTAIRHLRRSSLLNLPFAVLPLPSVLMGYCKLQFKLPFHSCVYTLRASYDTLCTCLALSRPVSAKSLTE